MKLYFIGGGDIWNNELEHIDSKVLAEFESPTMCVLLWTALNLDPNDPSDADDDPDDDPDRARKSN